MAGTSAVRSFDVIIAAIPSRLIPLAAVLLEDPNEVAAAYAAVIERIGWKAAQRQLGIKINVGRAPTHAELADAANREHLSVIQLRPV
jgi:hypothetical protein